MKKKRTIIIEFDRVKITTTLSEKNHLWCELCQSEAEFISRSEAAALVKIMNVQGLSVRREALHLYEAIESGMLICLNSIVNGTNNLQIK